MAGIAGERRQQVEAARWHRRPLAGEHELEVGRREAGVVARQRRGERRRSRARDQLAARDRDVDRAERAVSARHALAVEHRQRARDAIVDRVACRDRDAREVSDAGVQPAGEHAARGVALTRVPVGGDVGRDAEQIAQLELRRIDPRVPGTARPRERDGAHSCHPRCSLHRLASYVNVARPRRADHTLPSVARR